MIKLPYNIIISFDLIFCVTSRHKKREEEKKMITNQIVIDG